MHFDSLLNARLYSFYFWTTKFVFIFRIKFCAVYLVHFCTTWILIIICTQSAFHTAILLFFCSFPFPFIYSSKMLLHWIAYGEFLTRDFFREIATFISRLSSFNNFLNEVLYIATTWSSFARSLKSAFRKWSWPLSLLDEIVADSIVKCVYIARTSEIGGLNNFGTGK